MNEIEQLAKKHGGAGLVRLLTNGKPNLNNNDKAARYLTLGKLCSCGPTVLE